jgi:hypothetical protein
MYTNSQMGNAESTPFAAFGTKQQQYKTKSGACYAVRSLLHISNTDTLKSIYFVYIHSLMKYGIIFWGNSSDSKKVFTLQKKIVRIVVGVKLRNSCRELFKRLQTLPLPCEYIFLLLNFIINHQEHFRPIQLYTVLSQESASSS